MKFRELLPFLTSRAPPLEMKGRVYASCVRSSMTYGSETRPLLVDVGLKFERAVLQMIRWMCGISLKHKRTNEELKMLVGVEPITSFISGGRHGAPIYNNGSSSDQRYKQCSTMSVFNQQYTPEAQHCYPIWGKDPVNWHVFFRFNITPGYNKVTFDV